ncbi:NAD(P)H-binding protein [Metabacillus herbersteinensis]|uniref:NAD(P)H-binding protein n=1 Tax=Metabacillus herbersteinensis TaxID=283816 RepID=A0ABV6GBW7_9BACI
MLNTNKKNELELIDQPILVLGGTGKTGRRVVERLKAREIPVRVGSRNGEQPFDWEDKSTWVSVLEGVRAVYIAYYPDLALPGASDDISMFAELALKNNVKRLVLLSGRGEDGAIQSEEALKKSNVEWTILRCSWFNQNFSENFLVDQVNDGTIALPVGKVTEPFIDVEDIADVAVKVLTEDGHVGELYELTGPRLMTFKEATEEIAKVTGRDIGYVELNIEEFKAGLKEAKTPSPLVELLIELFTTVLDGRNSEVKNGVQRALGRKPRDFREYVQETVVSGVWNK